MEKFNKNSYYAEFENLDGTKRVCIYEGKSAGKAKDSFHFAVPLLRAASASGILMLSEAEPCHRANVTAFVQFENGKIVDTVNAGYSKG